MPNSRLGADVTVADNGEVAIAKLAATPFEVVLMDCQMPVLDGYEATRRMRVANPAESRSRRGIKTMNQAARLAMRWIFLCGIGIGVGI